MTENEPRYKVARTTEQVCALMGISTVAVMRRLRRPDDFLDHEGRGVTAAEFFEGWDAMIAEANRPSIPLELGQAYARGPFNAAYYAFTCSPTVQVGIERLSLFKPLSGPLSLHASRLADQFRIVKTTNTPGLTLPPSFAATELVFLITAMRICTGAHIVPRSVQITADLECRQALEAELGCPVKTGGLTQMTLALEDADRELLSGNPDQWALIEPGYQRALADLTDDHGMAARVRTALSEMLPAGYSGVGDAADRLRLSRRSLQRHLKEEGTSFQSLLDETRQSLALNYLQKTELSIDEISFLLAYRDPNSFYRAFHGWTGMTPLSARNDAVGGAIH